MDFENGDVLIYETSRGERNVAIRRNWGFAQWVVANWGFGSLTDGQVEELMDTGRALHIRPHGWEEPIEVSHEHG